jgi:hypothetical protein
MRLNLFSNIFHSEEHAFECLVENGVISLTKSCIKCGRIYSELKLMIELVHMFFGAKHRM